jgi:hypothetical protein
MALKNATSLSKNSFNVIQKCLASHGARTMIFDYNLEGQIIGLKFSLDIAGRTMGFKIPAKLENTCRLMYGHLLCEFGTGVNDTKKKEQVYKTTWANIRDWITAQMAMIDTNQVKFEEVFLPYIIIDKNGTTMFEKLEDKKFLLNSGE